MSWANRELEMKVDNNSKKQMLKMKLRHKIPQTCKKDVEKKQKITKGMRFQTVII